jgi:DNA polymerase III alpha subunit (gram-positive type)
VKQNVAQKKEDSMRYLCLDFETNGRPQDWVRPCGAFPTQVSVTAFVPATDEVTQLYDSFIYGAESLSDWVESNTPVRLKLLETGQSGDEVSAALAALWQEGDIVVAHNAQFDLRTVLSKIAWFDHPFFANPSICTMCQPWARKITGKQPTMSKLCGFFKVPYTAKSAHDARYDSKALACCMKAIHKGGLVCAMKLRERPVKQGQYTIYKPGFAPKGLTHEDRMTQRFG